RRRPSLERLAHGVRASGPHRAVVELGECHPAIRQQPRDGWPGCRAGPVPERLAPRDDLSEPAGACGSDPPYRLRPGGIQLGDVARDNERLLQVDEGRLLVVGELRLMAVVVDVVWVDPDEQRALRARHWPERPAAPPVGPGEA